MYVCMYVCMYVWRCLAVEAFHPLVCMYVCTHTYIHTHVTTNNGRSHLFLSFGISNSIGSFFIYVYIYTHTCIHTHTHTHTHKHSRNDKQRPLPFISIIRHLKPHRKLFQNLVRISFPARKRIRIRGRLRLRHRICAFILTRCVCSVAVRRSSVGVSRGLMMVRRHVDAFVVVECTNLFGCGLAVYCAARCA